MNLPAEWRNIISTPTNQGYARGDSVNHFENITVWIGNGEKVKFANKRAKSILKEGGKEVEKGTLKLKGKEATYRIFTSPPLEDDFLILPSIKTIILEIPGEGIIIYEAWEDDFDVNKVIKLISWD